MSRLLPRAFASVTAVLTRIRLALVALRADWAAPAVLLLASDVE